MVFQLDLSGCSSFCSVNRESSVSTALTTVIKLVSASSSVCLPFGDLNFTFDMCFADLTLHSAGFIITLRAYKYRTRLYSLLHYPTTEEGYEVS